MIAAKVPAAGTIEVRSPFDNAPIATLETSGIEAVEQALEKAYTLFRDRDSWLPLTQRIAIL